MGVREEFELSQTIEARLTADVELAKTLVKKPRDTIEPSQRASAGGLNALNALRALGASLEGKVSLHDTIGEGGMGVVHLATQATLGRHVAVKTLRAGAGDVDATLRILREAWVTGALEHPNVVPVYDVGIDDKGSPVIVMKRIEGRPWGALMRAPAEIPERFSVSDPLEWNVEILVSVCNAVHFAHSRGILHRDLKPENVMVGAFGEVYVLDWGIAVSLRDDPSGRLPLASQATEVAGTPCYMAPEMLLGDPTALSVRTDVYLLGAIFFEIFAGSPPHEGANVQAMVSSVLLSTPRFPAKFPSEARRICERAMARDPADRFESAEEFRIAIEGYLQHRGSRKLAWDAKQSLERLLRTLEDEPAGEERTLAVFNLLGECRFGYRAALSAWKDNEVARKGLDRALLAVIEHELAGGDPHAAATLLREVSAPPPDIAARVEAAARARQEHDERLRRLEADLDPRTGTRTRSLIGGVFGVAWTLVPLWAWLHVTRGHAASHEATLVASAVFLAFGLLVFVWARETLSKTLINRRLARSLGLHLAAQMLLGSGAWIAGLSPHQSQLLHVFTWALTQTMLAIWVERWFGVVALASAVSFLVAAASPRLLYPAMAIDNALFTLLIVRYWIPRDDLARIARHRAKMRRRARRWLEAAEGGEPDDDEASS